MRNKAGVSLYIAIFFIVILGIIVGALGSMGRLSILGGQSIVFTDEVFFLAESGIEEGINWLRNKDADLNWYNNAKTDGTSEPKLDFSIGLDQSIQVEVKYPATALRDDIADPDEASVTFLNVYSVDWIKEAGQIQMGEFFYVRLGDDVIRISYYDSNLIRLGIFAGIDSKHIHDFDDKHSLSDIVYPLTVLETDISVTDTVLMVNNTRGFLAAGTIQLYNHVTGAKEYIRYNRKTENSFIGCLRGSNGTVALDPNLSEIQAFQWRIVPVAYEASVISKGTTKGVAKTLDVTVQLKEF